MVDYMVPQRKMSMVRTCSSMSSFGDDYQFPPSIPVPTSPPPFAAIAKDYVVKSQRYRLRSLCSEELEELENFSALHHKMKADAIDRIRLSASESSDTTNTEFTRDVEVIQEEEEEQEEIVQEPPTPSPIVEDPKPAKKKTSGGLKGTFANTLRALRRSYCTLVGFIRKKKEVNIVINEATPPVIVVEDYDNPVTTEEPQKCTS